MTLSEYHKKYAGYSDAEMLQRTLVKERELEQVFTRTSYHAGHTPVRIAVLGCGDRRLVRLHQEMFERLLEPAVDITTFDITTEHLAREPGVVRHDASEPLPRAPYDIIMSHILLPFIDESSKKWDMLCNAHRALREPGIAIHVVGEKNRRIEEWRSRFERKGIRVEIIRLTVEGVLPSPLHSQALITRI